MKKYYLWGKCITWVKQIDFNNLTYYFKDQNIAPINFINLNEIARENPKTKSKHHVDTIKNINNIYESREEIIKFYNDYAKIKFEQCTKQIMVQEL